MARQRAHPRRAPLPPEPLRRYRPAAFKYLYDFGDHWEHLVTVEDVHPRTDRTQAVVCLAGENACPPEDVGGPPGYFEFLAAIRDPTHDEHANLLRWIGGAFDPIAFDLVEVNARLAKSRPERQDGLRVTLTNET